LSKLKLKLRQKTKIVATVGPASNSKEGLLQLIKEGVDVFRLNFSHGSHEDHLKVINNIIELTEQYDIPIGILADLQGPKLRVGEIENGSLELLKGDVLTFVPEPCLGNREKIYMSYESFAEDVKVGERVLVDDGKLILEVIEIKGKAVKLKVIHGKNISSKKGVNLPETKISLPCLTEKDLNDLEFILTQPVNWIALSFVREASDIEEDLLDKAWGLEQTSRLSCQAIPKDQDIVIEVPKYNINMVSENH